MLLINAKRRSHSWAQIGFATLALVGSLFAWPAVGAESQLPPSLAAGASYPEVWGRVLPDKNQIQPGSLEGVLLDSGDVVLQWRRRGRAESKAMTFFDGRSVRLLDTDQQSGRRTYQFADGRLAYSAKWATGTASFQDGSYVSVEANSYRDCWRGPDNIAIVKRAGDSALLWQKHIFQLLRNPETFSAGLSGHCPEGRFPRLTAHSKPLAGGLLKLNDQTFLVVDESGVIVRFDSELNSRSSIVGTEVFVLEGKPGQRLMSGITGKDYYPDTEGRARYQEALDDLYAYLTSLKKASK